MPRKDGCTFRIAFHSQYFFPPVRINREYASVAKRLWREIQPYRQFPHQSGRQIPRVFPSSGTISATPSYNDPGRILTGGPPAARRGDIGAVLLQDHSPSTASSPLQSTIPEPGFRGGVYCDNMIIQKNSSDVSSNWNEWSHSWAMRKQKKTINISNGETTSLCWEKNKLTVTG